MQKIQIAAILTVFNRKQKTLSCLQHLYSAAEAYNAQTDRKADLALTVFLTDDGCTDGTADALKSTFPNNDIRIQQGNGSLFWAGGMRVAWQAAIDSGTAWDYYLLLNDDTNVFNNLFQELFLSVGYEEERFGVKGLVSGFTCEPGNKDKTTYCGLNFVNFTRGRMKLIQPTGKPQRIDLAHANILLVSSSVVEKIGMFHSGFVHACADMDYSMTAHRHKLPVFSTPHTCGECSYDHHNKEEEIEMLEKLSMEERKKFVSTPTHSDRDHLLFVRRSMPMRYPFTLMTRSIRVYFPSLYHKLSSLRGLYKDKI